MKFLDNACDILYHDNHLLIVNKPPGLLTQPTYDVVTSVEEYGKGWIKQQFNKPGNVFLHAVHRLDKKVSGIVILARTSKALSRLNEALRLHAFQKTYTAIINHPLKIPERELIHSLVHDDFKARVVPEGQGKKAILFYKTLEIKKEHTLIEVFLKTGRYHQIRVQLAAIGHPILYDELYGCTSHHPHMIALCHTRLSFPHPISKQILTFTAPLPYNWPWDTLSTAI